MTFLQAEKKRQTVFKLTSNYFTKAARKPGLYRSKLQPFCLPIEEAHQNLFPPIRDAAIDYFSKNQIVWHSGPLPDMPSNHLCSSQVFCVNFLFPFFDKPEALKSLLLLIFPDIHRILPIENENQYIAFEWIGDQNYLNEKPSLNNERKRGLGTTSIDAVVLLETTSNEHQFVLIEWKYAEFYQNQYLRFSQGGTDRSLLYKPLLTSENCPIRKDLLQSFDDLLYDPFYQMLRQQLLAYKIEQIHKENVQIATVLHTLHKQES